MPPLIFFSRRVRETPFERRVLEQGARAFTVYNQDDARQRLSVSGRRLLAPARARAALGRRMREAGWRCAGPDALRLVELATPRDISACRVGQCVYAPLCDEAGGIVNDPIILRLAEDRFWVSIADSGVLLWLKGLAVGRGFDVEVFEPNVNICALQGPKADTVLQTAHGFGPAKHSLSSASSRPGSQAPRWSSRAPDGADRAASRSTSRTRPGVSISGMRSGRPAKHTGSGLAAPT